MPRPASPSRPSMRSRPRGPERHALRSVEDRDPDRDAQHRHRSGQELHRVEPGEGASDPEHPVAHVQGADAGEEAEVDPEGIGPRAEALDPEERHPHELHGGVRQRDERQATGLVAVRVHQLEPPEGQDPGGRRPSAEPARVGEWCRRPRPRPAAERPAARARGRPPRVERPEDVAEDRRHHHQADPEDHIDERWQQVRVGARAAGQAAGHQPAECQHAHGARGHLRPEGEAQQRAPVALPQKGGAPQDAQREERDQQHQPRSPDEEPLGNGEVGAGDQAVPERVWRGQQRDATHDGDRRQTPTPRTATPHQPVVPAKGCSRAAMRSSARTTAASSRSRGEARTSERQVAGDGVAVRRDRGPGDGVGARLAGRERRDHAPRVRGVEPCAVGGLPGRRADGEGARLAERVGEGQRQRARRRGQQGAVHRPRGHQLVVRHGRRGAGQQEPERERDRPAPGRHVLTADRSQSPIPV